MNAFFRRLPLQAKLMLIGLIPFGFLVYLTVKVYDDKTEKLLLFSNYKNFMAESANINGLIDALQEERKFSYDYAMTKNMHQELLLQRPRTDAYIRALQQSNDPSIKDFKKYTKLGDLEKVRNRVDSMKIPPNEIMHFYSNSVFRMNTLNTIPPANTPYLGPIYNDLMAQKLLSEMQTYLGIIRSNIYNVLRTREYMVETLMGTYPTYDVYKSYELEFQAKATPRILERYNTIRTETALKPTLSYIDRTFKTFAFDDSFEAADWWKVSDEGTGELGKFQSEIWKDLNRKVNALHQREYESRSRTLIVLILALACVFFIVAYIVYIIGRTLNELKVAAEKIAAGEPMGNVRIDSNDAIGSLARSIMRLNDSNQELSEAAVAIGKGKFDIPFNPRSDNDQLGNAIVRMKSDLQRYNLEMEQLVNRRTEELARSNEDLRQFAHVASHDMKEPLRKITMFSRILHDEQDQLTPKGKIYLEKITNAALRMSAMIEGVLSYSVVAANEPLHESVDPDKILAGVANDLELAMIQKDAKINYTKLPHVKGIAPLLQQLFYNIINNALKFSKPDVPPVIGIVAARVKGEAFGLEKDDFIHFAITDNGIGFESSACEKIFGIFSRLHSKDHYEGSGIGLALCRKIAERHGGKLFAESHEGKGATFHLLLPAAD